ncbi:hypothetical protein GQ55_1G108100 [Panicum hallii var. hallii]|uniref:Uncharacterized protein n=1 Tax=Panicum hallii var. hallii TaxID=1504633 RepID=A0A2T7F4H8_9POAL|nr:hypothetical protein GQ55_1G108100 [Panicum hallii var. hallii]
MSLYALSDLPPLASLPNPPRRRSGRRPGTRHRRPSPLRQDRTARPAQRRAPPSTEAASGDASGGTGASSLTAGMEESGDGMPRQRRDVSSTNHSSNSDAVAEGTSGVPHETSKHCQDAESEKTEDPPCKKNLHGFNECSSSKNLERTKCRWSPEENELLAQLVNKHGTKNWQTIACAIPDRNAHACLSRWKYILDPAINKEAWSQQEELRLIRAHQIYGNKWCKMVKHFPGRTNNALKEHWRGSMKRKLDSYLASGLLEQVPDLHESLSVPQSSQSDIPKDSKLSSDRIRFSSILSTSSKFKQELRELSEDADTSVGESSDFIYAKAFDADSAKVSESIIAKPQQCATARKKLNFMSSPVKLKSDVPPETVKQHRHEMESEKTEGSPCKKNGYCFKQGSSLKKSERTKGRWLAEENEILTKMVTKHGLKNWRTIASAIPGRNAQQCRIRWARSLDPAVNKEDWSEQEELKLIRAHQIYGSQWLKMVKHFPGRTNHALKEHWRGRMKGKLNYYLASGMLEQIPDLQEDLSVRESSQSDIPKDGQGSSERNRPPSLPIRPKPKSDLSELDENASTSEEESSDCMYPKGLDAHSAKVSEKVMAKSKQRARARRKLDFLSTPVELKVCTAAASCQRPPPEMEQTTTAGDNISPSDVCQDIPQNAASERVDVVIPTAASNPPNDVHSWATPDPCSPEIHEANASDPLDMSYCDDLIIDSPPYLHGSSFL